MKKYITILNWSHFFPYFLSMCFVNAVMGSLILSDYMPGTLFFILFIYPLCILFLPSYYELFYEPQNDMKCLSVIPVTKREIRYINKISVLCLIYFPAIVLACVLLIKRESFGFAIIPDYLLAHLIYHLVRKNNDEASFHSMLFLLGVLPLIILLLFEIWLFRKFT